MSNQNWPLLSAEIKQEIESCVLIHQFYEPANSGQSLRTHENPEPIVGPTRIRNILIAVDINRGFPNIDRKNTFKLPVLDHQGVDFINLLLSTRC